LRTTWRLPAVVETGLAEEEGTLILRGGLLEAVEDEVIIVIEGCSSDWGVALCDMSIVDRAE